MTYEKNILSLQPSKTQSAPPLNNRHRLVTVVLLVVLLGAWTVLHKVRNAVPPPVDKNIVLVWLAEEDSLPTDTYQCGRTVDDVITVTAAHLPADMVQVLNGRQNARTLPCQYSGYIHYVPDSRASMSQQITRLQLAMESCFPLRDETVAPVQSVVLVGRDATGAKLAQDFAVHLTQQPVANTSMRVMAVVNYNDELQAKYRWLERGHFPLSIPLLTVFDSDTFWRAPGVLAASLFHDVLSPRAWDSVSNRTVNVQSRFFPSGTATDNGQPVLTRLALTVAFPDGDAKQNSVPAVINSFLDQLLYFKRSSGDYSGDNLRRLVELTRRTKALTMPLLDALVLDSAAALIPHCGFIDDAAPDTVNAYLPCAMGSTWVESAVQFQLLSGHSGNDSQTGLAARGVQLNVTDEFHRVWIHVPLHFPAEVGPRCHLPDSTCHLHTSTVSHQFVPESNAAAPNLPIFKGAHERRQRAKIQRTWVSAVETRTKVRSRQAVHAAAGVVRPSFSLLDGDASYCADMNIQAQLYAHYKTGLLRSNLSAESRTTIAYLDQQVRQQWQTRFNIVRDDRTGPLQTADLEGTVAVLLSGRFRHGGVPMVFPADLNMINGGRWILEPMKLRFPTQNGRVYEVQARSHAMKFQVDFVIPAVAGIHYCKSVGVGAAVEWIYAAVCDP